MTDDNSRLGVLRFFVFLWFTAACFAVVSSKETLQILHAPGCLTVVQMSSSCVCCCLALLCRRGRKMMVSVPRRARKYVLAIGLSYTCGFFLTNFAINAMSTSLAETIKCAEPVSSVLLGALFTPEGCPSRWKLASLVPIVVGVGMTTFSAGGSVTASGVLAALGANICFSVRGMVARQLRYSDAAIDDVQLFLCVSFIGVVVFTPVAYLSEGGDISTLTPHVHFSTVAMLALFNGVMYYLYNQSSFAVLSRVQLVTHATFNVIRRGVVIIVAKTWFHTPMTMWNRLGLLCAAFGCAMFIYTSHSPTPRPKPKHDDTMVTLSTVV